MEIIGSGIDATGIFRIAAAIERYGVNRRGILTPLGG